ncbi:unnamed protein product [Vitrella brassicaformis CCMP3155]|uniref:Uncharacterized protein n=1 Tax=Vitrella brassicaformis (strain CCMP3155) TaxID=1169540 RepID=A0A0G4ERN3_VITBC|nr:unnamed protein product [Vitrella brassicaformis CCMP3155]|eukprot:CEM00399.1 unnamed protein product [Vitrella brassicaformis CCMP3155]
MDEQRAEKKPAEILELANDPSLQERVMMGSSPRVMTLEEAGDQLIRAERAAKGSITITLPASGGANCLLFLLLVVLGGAAWAHVVIGDINRVQLVAHEATIKALQQHLVDKDALIGQHEVAMGEKEAANVLLQDQLATATADLATATADLKNKTAAITAFHEQVARLTEDLHNTTEALQQRDKAIVALEDRFQASERALARANERLKKWYQAGGGFVKAAMVPLWILSFMGTLCSFCAVVVAVLGPPLMLMHGELGRLMSFWEHVFLIIGAAAALAFCIWALRVSNALL